MGYRMNIKELGSGKHIELGKFYGYLDDSTMSNLRSIRCLMELRGLDYDKLDYLDEFLYAFNCCDRNEIRMTGHEFRLFIDLYQADINSIDWDSMPEGFIRYPKNYKICDYYTDFNDIYFSNNMKIVYWT